MGIGDKIKGIGELVVQVHDADLKVELQQRILDLQSDCFTLQERNSEVLARNTELREALDAASKRADVRKCIVMMAESAYVFKDELGRRVICSACFESKGVTIPLTYHLAQVIDGICPSCKAKYPGSLAKRFVEE